MIIQSFAVEADRLIGGGVRALARAATKKRPETSGTLARIASSQLLLPPLTSLRVDGPADLPFEISNRRIMRVSFTKRVSLDLQSAN